MLIDQHWDGDGLIVFRHSQEEARAWRKRGVAVVNLSAEYPGDSPVFPQCTMDNVAAGIMAARHLASLGLRDFCFINESTRKYSLERLEGFLQGVNAASGRLHRIDVPVSTFPVRDCPKRIERTIWPLLAELPRPCGIFTKDDIAAVWTLLALEKLGIRTPDDMPVLGVDDDVIFCHTTTPPISSIAYPGRVIGFEAASLLDRMLTGSSNWEPERLSIAATEIVIRESTRHVVLSDALTTRAMAYIREHAAVRSLQVAEVARHCGVSRESLRLKFREQLGHSPKEEIERLRLRNVMDLLRSNRAAKLEEIAYQSGFSGGDELCRFVKRMTGRTPGSLRHSHDGVPGNFGS